MDAFEKDYFKGSKNPIDIWRSFRFDAQFYQDNPNYFNPAGIWVFCGAQGSGKTLSAVKCLKKLVKAYPFAKVCTNLDIHDLPCEVIRFTDYGQLETLTNGIEGVIFLIDEIHVLWNSLESKNIPISEMALFSQMRKDRRIILGTAQVYGRIAKPIREQLRYVIKCRNIFKYIQINDIIDPNADGYTGENEGHLDGEIVYRSIFFHSPADYKAYDTLNKIERIERKCIK